MKAIIMAGGEGSRLRPLTCDRPKPMVPLMNRPTMEYIVALLRRYGLRDIGVTLQYMPEKIEDYFGDGKEFAVSMRYFIEDTPLGTAGSVKNAADFINNENFLVISGDALTDFDLQKAIDFHRQKGGIGTLVLTSVAAPLEYGVVIAAPDGRIKQFLEKPGWGEVFSDTVNTGIYILEPEALQFIPENTKFDFAKDLFPLLMKKGYPLYGYVAEGYWCDIGNISQYYEAHLDIMRGKVKLELPLPELSPGVYAARDAVIEEGAQITGPVFIDSGTRIRKNARVGDHTVIGPHSLIDSGASVKRSLCWGNNYLGANTELRGAVLCSGVQVMSRSALYEGVVVGDCTVVEENCTVKPEVKIWPHKRIGSGSIVSENVIWSTKAVRNLFGRDGISGVVNLDITPEMVTKLAAAYGTSVGEGGRVTLSCDDRKASRMLKEAARAGLLSVGINVLDLGISVTPVTRFAVGRLDVRGGMHIQLSPADSGFIQIKFFDEKGLSLTRDRERSIEQVYYREEYKRPAGINIGETTISDGFAAVYRDALLKRMDTKAFQARKFRILLAYPSNWLYNFLVPLLQELYCEVITVTSAGREPQVLPGLQEKAEVIGSKVRETGADLGAAMDANAENLILFDRQGRMIAEEMLLALTSAVIFRTEKGATVAVPVTAPSVIEKLAARYKGKVQRTKTSPRALMEALSRSREGRDDPFIFSFDAVSSLLNILDFLAVSAADLRELVDSIPPFYLHKCEVDCSWGDKGAVMRRLIEETCDCDVELLDGIKVRHEQGWALVLPDSERPVYRIYGEGYNAEAAEELTNMYTEKIKQYQRELKKGSG